MEYLQEVLKKVALLQLACTRGGAAQLHCVVLPEPYETPSSSVAARGGTSSAAAAGFYPRE